MDTWYLLGWLNKLRADFERSKVTESKDEDISEGYLGNARYYLNKSMKVQHKTPTDDKELVSLKYLSTYKILPQYIKRYSKFMSALK